MGRITPRQIIARKGGAPIAAFTAYSAPMASLIDEVCDLILVGDSVGMVVHGLPNTVGVTLEMMILHGAAVVRGSQRALVAVDMPFGSYEASPMEAFAHAARMLKETGAGAVKLEAGRGVAATIAFLVECGAPVIGHVGLRPQAVLAEGGFRAKGRSPSECRAAIAEAEAAAAAGAFCIVAEGVAESLAREITARVPVPTIGIGAGAACDGQNPRHRGHARALRLDAEVRAPLRQSEARDRRGGPRLRRGRRRPRLSRRGRDLFRPIAGRSGGVSERVAAGRAKL